MEKEDQILLRHFTDRSRLASRRGVVVYSDFLNQNESTLLMAGRSDYECKHIELFGGFLEAERLIAAFIPEGAFSPEQEDYPITCIQVSSLSSKFLNALTHRDYLGAILGLGLDRSKIGDIIVEDQEAYFFCINNIASFLIEELRQIGRHSVTCTIINKKEHAIVLKTKEITGTVSSVRLDAVASVTFQTSRKQMQDIISSGKVFVNSKNILSAHYFLNAGDIVSVRGMGKFRYEGENGTTRKSRTVIRVLKYV